MKVKDLQREWETLSEEEKDSLRPFLTRGAVIGHEKFLKIAHLVMAVLPEPHAYGSTCVAYL